MAKAANTDSACGTSAQIDDAASDIWTTIVDPNHYAAAIAGVGDLYPAAER